MCNLDLPIKDVHSTALHPCLFLDRKLHFELESTILEKKSAS